MGLKKENGKLWIEVIWPTDGSLENVNRSSGSKILVIS
jgi:hypothetical protein